MEVHVPGKEREKGVKEHKIFTKELALTS